MSYFILSTFTIATLRYVTSEYNSLGLVTLQHFFVPAFYLSAYKSCYISIWKQFEV